MHEGHRNRLRERVEKSGIESLLNHELLELFLFGYIPRKDTNSIAHDLLNTFGSLSQVLDADIEDLVSIKNMTRQAAIALHTLPLFVKRYINDKNIPKKNLSTIANTVKYIKSETDFLTRERLLIMCLDIHFNLIKTVTIKSNSVDYVDVSLKDIHTAVLRQGTKNIILAHNHPAGSVLPSDEDIAVTKDIIMSMFYIEVDVLDHIIVTKDDYFSFREKGLLDELTPKHAEKSSYRYVAEKNKIGAEYED